ncbi:MAG: uracil-DNA glycosylase [Planctomycetota bacterium]
MSEESLDPRDLIAALRRHVELEKLFGQTDARKPEPRPVPSAAEIPREAAQPEPMREASKAPESSRKASAPREPLAPATNEIIIPPEIALQDVREEANACTRCRLAETRTNVVFGEGSLSAQVMFVGEGPGADEDEQGRPFVGKAGQLLTKIIESIQLRREDVYIANVLKCRPPNNRDPRPDEVACCIGYLKRQIAIIRPVVICTLGSHAARAVLGVTRGVTSLRGKVHHWQGCQVVPTWHPAYLLRNPPAKRDTWDDIRLVKRLLDESAASE